MKLRADTGIDFNLAAEHAAKVAGPVLVGKTIADLEDVLFVLESALEFEPGVPESDRRSIIAKGLRAAGKSTKPFTAKSLLYQIGAEETKYLARPMQPYTLATSLSMYPWHAPFSTTMSGTTIDCFRDFPPRIRAAREKFKDPAIPVEDILPQGYTVVCVRVRARSIHAAVEHALDALDSLRGIWNFAINGRVYHQVTPGEFTPVNRIRLGRVHTLHLPNGELAHEGYHYEPASSPDRSVYSYSTEITKVRKTEAVIRRRLAKIPYRAEMLRAFARYARAFDTADYDSALLRLWSLLEFLTATEHARYDDLVKRASFLQGDTAWARVVLQHLRNKRNSGVHADTWSGSARGLVWQLKRSVERALTLHIVWRGEFATRRAAADFMDLPPAVDKLNADIALLRERIKLHKSAVKYRTPPKNPTRPAGPADPSGTGSPP